MSLGHKSLVVICPHVSLRNLLQLHGKPAVFESAAVTVLTWYPFMDQYLY